MLGILHSYFNEISFDAVAKSRKQTKPSYIRRDDLDKKFTPSKLRKRAEGEAKPLLERQADGKKLDRESRGRVDERGGGLQVKILMTKEEAARLLSKCKNGGVLEFTDVARELVQIPSGRVSVVSSGTGKDRVLGSIPEEF